MITNLNDNVYCRELRKIFKISLEAVATQINYTVEEVLLWEEERAGLPKDKLRLYLKFLNEYRYNI